ncbi:hypothetical protein BN2475_1140009 [Paraburkholderia ribeironis]|uniref:Uncharacterized protein n=1 Tax=Paraburkholderia ribeironis TaxID=1247936 RepID=A0A1N7SN97_9BURK|nr:hypothetical protein BN2475_1140009 [Paraburkholderia ribeironis]
MRLLRRRGCAAVRGRPFGRRVQEFFHFLERPGVEVLVFLRDAQHVPPRGKRMQVDVDVFQHRHAFLEDVVVEQHEAVVHRGAGRAQRVDEVDLAAAVGGQVFDQQHALTFGQQTFDLRVTAETLGLLAHVLHRHHQAVGQPCRERNASGFATGHGVDLLVADVAQDGGLGHFHQTTAHARIRDQLAAVDINGARPAGRENVRFLRVEVHCLHFQQHFGGRVGDRLAIEACHGRILRYERGEAGAGPDGAASEVAAPCRAGYAAGQWSAGRFLLRAWADILPELDPSEEAVVPGYRQRRPSWPG